MLDTLPRLCECELPSMAGSVPALGLDPPPPTPPTAELPPPPENAHMRSVDALLDMDHPGKYEPFAEVGTSAAAAADAMPREAAAAAAAAERFCGPPDPPAEEIGSLIEAAAPAAAPESPLLPRPA